MHCENCFADGFQQSTFPWLIYHNKSFLFLLCFVLIHLKLQVIFHWINFVIKCQHFCDDGFSSWTCVVCEFVGDFNFLSHFLSTFHFFLFSNHKHSICSLHKSYVLCAKRLVSIVFVMCRSINCFFLDFCVSFFSFTKLMS